MKQFCYFLCMSWELWVYLLRNRKGKKRKLWICWIFIYQIIKNMLNFCFVLFSWNGYYTFLCFSSKWSEAVSMLCLDGDYFLKMIPFWQIPGFKIGQWFRLVVFILSIIWLGLRFVEFWVVANVGMTKWIGFLNCHYCPVR